MIRDLLRIIDDNKENIVDQMIEGHRIVQGLRKIRRNTQCYILTPVSTLLSRSGYSVYTHILGVSLPQLPSRVSENVESIVSKEWCKDCYPKFRDRCLNKATSSEIDALVLSDDKICAIEHASNIEELCWDMIKLHKLVTSRKGISSCLFITWYNIEEDEHERFAETLIRLGEMLFDNSIGEDEWAVIYVKYLIKNKTYNIIDLDLSIEL